MTQDVDLQGSRSTRNRTWRAGIGRVALRSGGAAFRDRFHESAFVSFAWKFRRDDGCARIPPRQPICATFWKSRCGFWSVRIRWSATSATVHGQPQLVECRDINRSSSIRHSAYVVSQSQTPVRRHIQARNLLSFPLWAGLSHWSPDRTSCPRHAPASDEVGVKEVFSKLVAVMHSVPWLIPKACRKATRVALQDVARDINEPCDVRMTFFLFPGFSGVALQLIPGRPRASQQRPTSVRQGSDVTSKQTPSWEAVRTCLVSRINVVRRLSGR